MSDTMETKVGARWRLTQTTLLLPSVEDLFFAGTLHEQLENSHLQGTRGQLYFSRGGKRVRSEKTYRLGLTDAVRTTDGLDVHLRIEVLVVAACAVANVSGWEIFLLHGLKTWSRRT